MVEKKCSTEFLFLVNIRSAVMLIQKKKQVLTVFMGNAKTK